MRESPTCFGARWSNRACSRASVTPVTSALKLRAACTDSDPQPQPTSSSLEPGPSPSLRQMPSSLSRWASASVYAGSSLSHRAHE